MEKSGGDMGGRELALFAGGREFDKVESGLRKRSAASR
jgi:hypothetical protein